MNWKKKQAEQTEEIGETAAEKGGAGAFLKRNAKWMIPVACAVAVIAALLLWPQNGGSASSGSAYVETALETRDVTNSLSGYGTLKPAQTYTVTSLVAGKILTADFSEGDEISEGQVLYTVDSADAATNVEKAQIALEQAQRSYEKIEDQQYVRAEAAGVVSSLKVQKGDEVSAGTEVAVIRDSSTMLLTLLFPAADAAKFTVGQSAQITLDGTFEQIEGTIKKVSGTDELSTGNLLTRTVTIAARNAGGLTTAQAATATVNGVSSLGSALFTYNEEKTLTASASGTVSELSVKEGDHVEKDDILISLTGDSLSESILSASETLRSAEISLKNVQDTLANYTITSPINGTVVEKDYKQGDSLVTSKTMCIIYDLSYLEMVINVDELNIKLLSVGQEVQLTADAITDRVYKGVVTRVSVAGTTSGGTTTYPVTIRIDDTDGLLPGMNANAEIVTEQAKDALVVPNAAVVRGSYVLVTQDSPSAVNAVQQMEPPAGYVYVQVTTGVSGDDYTQITSGLQAGDVVAYDPSSVGDSTYYDDYSYFY